MELFKIAMVEAAVKKYQKLNGKGNNRIIKKNTIHLEIIIKNGIKPKRMDQSE